MKKTNKQYAQALYEATKDLSGRELSSVIGEFLKLLVNDHKLKSADKIIIEFVKYAKKQAGIMDIEITTAKKLDTKIVDEIKNIFGKETESIEKVDNSLLGGVKIRTDNIIFDASIKTQLIKLKQVFQ